MTIVLPRFVDASWKSIADLQVITVGFTHYTHDQKIAVMRALDQISNHCNVIFVPAETGEVEFQFGEKPAPVRGSVEVETDGDRITGGTITLNDRLADEQIDPNLIVHEMMHVLGIGHPEYAPGEPYDTPSIMNFNRVDEGIQQIDIDTLQAEFGRPWLDLPADFWSGLLPTS